MITFESQKAFEDAVMEVLAERLRVDVYVSKKCSQDYYSREEETSVEVTLNDVTVSSNDCISSSEAQA